MSDPYVSLASSTSTAIESASKHNIQCRVSTDHIMQWTQSSATTGDTAATIIRDNKMNYCMNKNDIVVGLRRGWFPQSCMQMRAYPLVVTTYADMCLAAQYWLMRLYNNAKDTTGIRLLCSSLSLRRGVLAPWYLRLYWPRQGLLDTFKLFAQSKAGWFPTS